MINLHRLGSLAILLASAASAGVSAETMPVGIVENPCVGSPELPASAKPYFRGLMETPAKAAPLPPEYTAFREASEKAKARDWANLCYYRADNARLMALPRSDRRVVYMGDSLTELWAISDPVFFTGGRVSRGIGGQTTGQMLLRFQSDVIALEPEVVHILAGTNDLAGKTGPQSMQDVRNNIIAMTAMAKANNIRVVLASVPPTLSFPWSPTVRPGPQIGELNRWLREFAAESGATYVDYYALLAAPDGTMQPALTMEGVHINNAGYKHIASLSLSATETGE